MRRDDRGVTLIELSIAMVISTLVMVAAYDMFATASIRTAELSARTTAENSARQALDALVKDARQSSTGRADLPRVQTAHEGAFVFYSPDASQPAVHLRRIEYEVVDGTLRRRTTVSVNGVDDPWAGRESWTWDVAGQWVDVVQDVVGNTLFTYRDASGAATNDPQAVQTISVELVIDPNGSRAPGVQSYELTIDIRGPS